jgi:cytidylate kinase
MYRALPISMQNGYIAPDFDKETLVHSLPFITLEFKFNAAVGFAEMYLNDVNVEKEIRTIKVSGLVK